MGTVELPGTNSSAMPSLYVSNRPRPIIGTQKYNRVIYIYIYIWTAMMGTNLISIPEYQVLVSHQSFTVVCLL